MTGVNLATAYYQLMPSMAGNQAAITKEMGAAGSAGAKAYGSSFSGGLKGLLGTAAVATATATAIKFVQGSIAEAREAQKVGALTAQVIKSTGGAANVTAGQVGNLASAISKKTGIDDEAIQTGANLLLTFKNVQNQAGKGNKVFNEATKAAVDLSAAGFGSIDSSAKMLGKALNDPVKGMTALGKAGVTFTAAQQEQIKAMVKSGDLLGAQKIILGEVKSQVGGAAAATATAGAKMGVAWGNLQEAIGTALLPVVDKLFAAMTKVFEFLSKHQSVMVILGTVIGVVLVAALVAATAAVWSFTVALLANPLTWIVIIIVAVIAAIAALVVGVVKLVQAIVKNWGAIKAKTAAIWGAITAWLSKAWSTIQAKAAAIWDGIKAKVSAAWDAIRTAVVSKATALVAYIKGLPGRILTFFAELPGRLANIGKDIVMGLRDGIVGAWHWVTDKVEELIALIPLAIRKLMGIASPSRVMMEIGAHVADGLALGMDRGSGRVNSSALALAASATDPINAHASSVAASTSRGPVVVWVQNVNDFDDRSRRVTDAQLNRAASRSAVFA